MKYFTLISTFCIFLISCQVQEEKGAFLSEDEIDIYWKTGQTLPLGIEKNYPLNKQTIQNDNGINILIDMSHQTHFNTLWCLTSYLNDIGFRSIGNQAVLHSVLSSKGKSRVRIPYKNGIYPFAWIHNLSYNVVMTEQKDPNFQPYLNEEIQALKKFVKEGGGLVIQCDPYLIESNEKEKSIENLLKSFGVQLGTKIDRLKDIHYATLQTIDKEWGTSLTGENGNAIEIRRKYGDGYVLIVGALNTFLVKNSDNLTSEESDKRNKEITERLKWVAQGKKPVGGEPRVPSTMIGGGGIYPELETNMGEIILLYAQNQKEMLLDCVNKDIPKVNQLINSWFPSKYSEPFYLVLSAGDGGGWVVDSYKPKEMGLISKERDNLIDAFSYEMGSMNTGPTNENGEIAGVISSVFYEFIQPCWFQGKIRAVYNEVYKNKPNCDCNSFFKFDPYGDKIDISLLNNCDVITRDEIFKKIWYIFQKLEDRYGTTWYPRWLWISHMRWSEIPEKQLTMEEIIEDICIAVGEDLFPFFNHLGTTLTKKRLEQIEFNNELIPLRIAPIAITPAGNVCFDSIHNYKQPIILSAD